MSKKPDVQTSLSLERIAQKLSKELNDNVGCDAGYCLMFLNVHEKSRVNYIYNCSKESVIKELKKLLKYWEDGPEKDK